MKTYDYACHFYNTLLQIFAIVVFGCIATNVNNHSCPYVSPGACGYGTAVGIVAFMGLVAFVVLDALFESIINLDNRRYVVISEISFLGLFGLLYLNCNYKIKIASVAHIYEKCYVDIIKVFGLSYGSFVSVSWLTLGGGRRVKEHSALAMPKPPLPSHFSLYSFL